MEGTDWYYAAGFDPGMPELNLDNPAVRGEITDIIAFWLAHGVGGFRLDAVTHYDDGQMQSNIGFLKWLDETVKGIDPEACEESFFFPVCFCYNAVIESSEERKQ